MAKTRHHYEARFSSGTRIDRKTDRDYTHAWIVDFQGEEMFSGFASSQVLAERAANQCLPSDHEKRFKRMRSLYARHETMEWLKKNFGGSWTKYQNSRAEALKDWGIEIVTCKEVS